MSTTINSVMKQYINGSYELEPCVKLQTFQHFTLSEWTECNIKNIFYHVQFNIVPVNFWQYF
jgi:hypothetical protein